MDLELARESLPALLHGALVTCVLVGVAVICGMVLAILIATARLSRNPLIWAPAHIYMTFFRGTPLLVQLFLIYYGPGQFAFIRTSVVWVVLRSAWWCGAITLTLCTAAYTAEIMRGAFLAVPAGDIDAAKALGMPNLLRFRRIVLPGAFRLALGAYSNEVIMLLKGSALVSTITIFDLTGEANQIYYRTYDPFTPIVTAGAIYLMMVFVITRGFSLLQSKLRMT